MPNPTNIPTPSHKKEFIQKSLKLTKEEWAALDLLAELLQTCPPSGTNAGQPSWRSLIKAVANSNGIRIISNPQ